jgi:hypothetical protein
VGDHRVDSFMDDPSEVAVPRRPGRARIAGPRHLGGSAMDKKAKTPKKPKQTKTKDGAAKGK